MVVVGSSRSKWIWRRRSQTIDSRSSADILYVLWNESIILHIQQVQTFVFHYCSAAIDVVLSVTPLTTADLSPIVLIRLAGQSFHDTLAIFLRPKTTSRSRHRIRFGSLFFKMFPLAIFNLRYLAVAERSDWPGDVCPPSDSLRLAHNGEQSQ